MLNQPDAPLPKACQGWPDLVAAYRLLNNPRVDPQAIIAPHCEVTREQCAEHRVILCIQDTTELNFTHHPAKKDQLGPLGKGQHGLLQHSVMAVVPGDRRLLGLLNVRWHVRTEIIKNETRMQRRARWRESLLWSDAVEAIGASPPSTRFILVADRGSDCFETMIACEQQNHGFVIRAQHDRYVEDSTDKLMTYMRSRTVSCTQMIDVTARRAIAHPLWRTRPARPAHQARLEIRFAKVTLDPPRNDPRHPQPRQVWAVHVSQINAPQDVEPIEWILLTSEPIQNAADALRIVDYYSTRWLIEEWHRAEKEGCAIEKSQLHEADALMRLAAIKAVHAVRLIQLRDLANDAGANDTDVSSKPKQSPSTADSSEALQMSVPWLWIAIVAHEIKFKDPSSMTPYQFWRGIARCGGFIGRKSDGRPGWKVIWRGWEQITRLVQGAMIGSQLKPRCV